MMCMSICSNRFAVGACSARSLVVRPKLMKLRTTTMKLHAMQPSAIQFGFTAKNEVWVGRMAMLGFVASLVGESITGQGSLAQLSAELGMSVQQTTAVLLGMTLVNTAIALLPKQSVDRDEIVELQERPEGSLQMPSISLLDPKAFFGYSEVGFTKANELFVGRVANLGFLMSIIGEWFTGKGALGQVQMETGLPVTDIEFGFGAMALLMLLGGLGRLSSASVTEQR